jgi:endonuclease/exonuclease/phosphatase family metal-dependent hydrolase
MKKIHMLATAAVVAGAGLLVYNKATTVNFGEINIDGVPEKAENATRVMSFNVRSMDDKEGSIKNRSKIVTAIIDRYAPDSLGVQEATGKWMDILTEALSEKYAYVTQSRDTKGYKTEHNPVFYLKDKFNLIDSGTIWLSETPKVPFSKSFDTNCTRIATWVVLENKATGEKYTHLNTHLDHILESTRVSQVKVLLEKLTELQKFGKVVCTGDFNTDPSSDVYAKMTAVLNDSKKIAENSDEGATFHGYGKCDEFAGPIDYIFTTKDTNVKTFKIIRNTAKGMYPSDHYPIVADIFMEEQK